MQVELAHSDTGTLGLDVPTRMSGDQANGTGCVIIGENEAGELLPGSELKVSTGLVRAWRHVHFGDPVVAKSIFGVEEEALMTVAIESEYCTTLLHDVSVRFGDPADPAPSFTKRLVKRIAGAVLFPILQVVRISLAPSGRACHTRCF